MLRYSTFWTSLTGTILLAIATATPIMMNSVMDRGYEVAKLSLAEPFAFFALASLLVTSGWRWVGQASVEARVASLCLVAFLGLGSISTALSDQPHVAFFGGYYRREGLLAWATYATFFIAMIGWARGQAYSGIVRFVDFLLLASVIPSVYAIQQRLGLDFFFVGNRDLTRPNGTLGNAIFLGAYFAILLPVTAVRCWQSRRHLPELALWLSLASLQLTGLLISQSRGPVLACILGAVLLSGMGAGYKQSRRGFYAIGLLLSAVLAVLVVINTHASAQGWAKDVPVLSRLVYNLEGSAAGTATSLASRSTAARLGIWRAATETFIESPSVAKWIGFGPEMSYGIYYPHLPDAVMQVDGYWQSNSYDRFHADTLDIALNYGLVGWLVYCIFFCTVLFAAARALFGIRGKWLCGMFVVLPLIGGAIAAGLALLAGLNSTIAPAAGLGIGAAWLVYFLGCAWHASHNGLPENVRSRPELWALLAGLTASLLVFWMDAQVNIPVLTTRLISFGVAALILAVASLLSKRAPPEPASPPIGELWRVLFPVVAACASFLPAVILDATMRARETERWWLSAIPIGLMLAFGAFHVWILRPLSNNGRSELWRWIHVALGLTAGYALCHWALIAKLGPVIDHRNVLQLAVVTSVGTWYALFLCVAFSWADGRRPDIQPQSIIPRANLVVAIPAFVIAMLVMVSAWTAIKADIGSTVASWANAKQPEVSDRILLDTIAAMPHERQYQRQRVFDLLGRAMEDIKRPGLTAESFPQVSDNMDHAEKQARDSLRQFPMDPWIVLALANALQIRALPAIRPFAAERGRQAALEADGLFARAYEIYPNQPLLLRNWAQLRFNEGDHWGAFRLLDRMEGIIPNEPEPYSERILLARQLDDSYMIVETIERAGKRLDAVQLGQLRIVANLQQR